MEFLRTDSDLGAHAELRAVGEGRRDVGVDAGGVDFALERADRLRVFGYDRLAVLRGVAGDVGERLVERDDRCLLYTSDAADE